VPARNCKLQRIFRREEPVRSRKILEQRMKFSRLDCDPSPVK
jgi:hypothetical protein